MKYTYNLSHKAIVNLIVHFCDRHLYGTPVQHVVDMLHESILGSEQDVLLKLVEELAATGYFNINNGKIHT